MSLVENTTAGFLLWADTVTRTLAAPLDRLATGRRIEAAEEGAGVFVLRPAVEPKGKRDLLAPLRVEVVDGAIDAALPPEWDAAMRGSRVELVLQPSHFLFRPLELPKRATEFLDGIVRAQIDRLTPWNSGEACFHWTPPQDIAGDRIALTVAATARAVTTPLARAFSDLGAADVEIATVVPGASPVRVTVFRQRAGNDAERGGLRAVVLAAFLGTALLAALSVGVSDVLGGRYDDELQQVQRQIAGRRALARGSSGATGASAIDLLEKRKHSTPSSVMVIEALSTLLPDHTYATEVRIEGEKLQLIGITRDAPALIELLERSPHFKGATFFAPTTRSPNDPAERFHIEARITPYFRTGT